MVMNRQNQTVWGTVLMQQFYEKCISISADFWATFSRVFKSFELGGMIRFPVAKDAVEIEKVCESRFP